MIASNLVHRKIFLAVLGDIRVGLTQEDVGSSKWIGECLAKSQIK